MAVWAGSALEVSDGAVLQPLAQLVDALGGVGAMSTREETAEPVVSETVQDGFRKSAKCHGAVTYRAGMGGLLT